MDAEAVRDPAVAAEVEAMDEVRPNLGRETPSPEGGKGGYRKPPPIRRIGYGVM